MIGIKNTTFLTFVLVLFVLFIPAVLLVERQTLYEITDALVAGAAIVCMVWRAKAFWRAVKLPPHELLSADYLIVGEWFLCLGCGTRFLGQWYWRAMDKPNWWIDSIPLLTTTVCIAIGLFLLQTTTWSERGVLVSGAYRRAGFLAAVSIAIATVLIWVGWG